MAGPRNKTGFVELEEGDLETPSTLNQMLRFIYERLASIEGVAGEYTFINPFKVRKVETAEVQDPREMEDNELLTKGAALEILGAGPVREALNTRVFQDERVRGIQGGGAGGETVQVRWRV